MSTNIVVLNVTQTIAPTPPTLQKSGALISQGATNTSPNTASLLTQLSDLTPLLTAAKAITGITQTTGTATATTTTPHGFTNGDTIYLTIAGATPAAYNGTFLCTITGASTFTYAVPSGTSSPATGSSIVYTPEDVAELLAMATTFFAQRATQAVYVLELGPGSPDDGVAALSAYITANPNSNYTPGAAGFFYSYLVPRTWDGNSNFLALIATLEGNTAKTYFYVTTTLSSYTLYNNRMKDVVAMIESPQLGVYPANALTAISFSGGLVTATTTSAHGVVPGDWFQINGVTPSGYNGWHLALTGTTGSTIVYSLAADPGVESVLGTLVASYYANSPPPSIEFSLAADFNNVLNYDPSDINKVAPNAYSFQVGVTPFPIRGNQALLQTLKDAAINIIRTGAEGGIADTIIYYGTTMDTHDITYWYSVDWVEINADVDISNEIINGSNNPQNPLYYDQPGINRLLARVQATMNRAINFGLALGPVTVTAVPFATYVKDNPSDYPLGIYKGLAVTYTPQRGFIQITFNIDVSNFPLG